MITNHAAVLRWCATPQRGFYMVISGALAFADAGTARVGGRSAIGPATRLESPETLH